MALKYGHQVVLWTNVWHYVRGFRHWLVAINKHNLVANNTIHIVWPLKKWECDTKGGMLNEYLPDT